MLPTIEWRDNAVVMIDQRKLPEQERYVDIIQFLTLWNSVSITDTTQYPDKSRYHPISD